MRWQRRPFRPSLSSFSRINSSLKPVQELTVVGDNLLKDIALVGGNQSGIFISSVKSGSIAEKAGLREGHHLLLVGCFALRVSQFAQWMQRSLARPPNQNPNIF